MERERVVRSVPARRLRPPDTPSPQNVPGKGRPPADVMLRLAFSISVPTAIQPGRQIGRQCNDSHGVSRGIAGSIGRRHRSWPDHLRRRAIRRCPFTEKWSEWPQSRFRSQPARLLAVAAQGRPQPLAPEDADQAAQILQASLQFGSQTDPGASNRASRITLPSGRPSFRSGSARETCRETGSRQGSWAP
jgi:hypothetical protein